jgi:hypothetical protein
LTSDPVRASLTTLAELTELSATAAALGTCPSVDSFMSVPLRESFLTLFDVTEFLGAVEAAYAPPANAVKSASVATTFA